MPDAGPQHPAPPDPPDPSRGKAAGHTDGCACRQCRRSGARLPAPHGVALTGAAATDDDVEAE